MVTMSKYVDAVCRNIVAIFQQSPLLAVFAVFDIRCLPERGTDEFNQYGCNDIHIFVDYFFGTQEDIEEMLAEWINFKSNNISAYSIHILRHCDHQVVHYKFIDSDFQSTKSTIGTEILSQRIKKFLL
jgi:hypothetical protein